MSGPIGARARRLAAMALAAVVLGLAFAWAAPAMAESIVINTTAKVQQGACEFCHANIADTKNYSQEIIFSHGLHILVACESCHSSFPHGRSGTTTPTMKTCFQCHGLRHGPMGILATGKCSDCHITPQERLRPAFHTPDWKFKPHVAPGRPESQGGQLQTKCMMCHQGKFCDDCHAQQGISWKPDVPYAYDPKDGCEACHGDANLVKATATGNHSFQVSTVQQSAHANISCIQCHPDFKYTEGTDKTRLWDVNAGLACEGCHTHDKVAQTYANSIHGIQLAKGNLKSATCASCHGGHDIQRLDTPAAKQQLHQAAYSVCARCHRDKYDSFDDYYHGRPYKEGNADAPACWDCHGSHDIQPSREKVSYVSAENLKTTCGGQVPDAKDMSCHTGSAYQFGAKAGELIHQKAAIRKSNALAQLISKVKGWFGGR